MAQCGSVCASLYQSGSVWVSVYGLIWHGLGQCGSVWVSVACCGFKGFQRISFCEYFLLGFCGLGSVWVSVAWCGSVWVSVDQCGWVYMV